MIPGIPNQPKRLPATFAFIGLMAVGFLLSWLPSTREPVMQLAALPSNAPLPWQFLTYPLFIGNAGSALLGLVFGAYWLLMIGQTFEGSVGSRAMAALLVGFTAIAGAMFWLGSLVAGSPGLLFGPYLTISYLTILWAARNPEQSILFMMFIPLKAKYLALLTAALVLFGYGAGAPVVGVALVLPMAAMWFFSRQLFGFLSPSPSGGRTRREKAKEEREFRSYMDDVRTREQERMERERLRKLFEDSVSDDDR